MTQRCLFAVPIPLFQCLWMGTIATKSGDQAVVCWEDLEHKSQPTSGLGGIACQGQDMAVWAQQLIQRINPINNVGTNMGEIRKPTEARTVLLSPTYFFPSLI